MSKIGKTSQNSVRLFKIKYYLKYLQGVTISICITTLQYVIIVQL